MIPQKKPPMNLGEVHRRDPRWGRGGHADLLARVEHKWRTAIETLVEVTLCTLDTNRVIECSAPS
jgi:hypothetical protein